MVLLPAGALIPGSDTVDTSSVETGDPTDVLPPLTRDDDHEQKEWRDLFPKDRLPEVPLQEVPAGDQADPLAGQARHAARDIQGLSAQLEKAPPAEALAILTAYADKHDLPPAPRPMQWEEALRSSGIDPSEIPQEMREPTGRIWASILVAEKMQEEATHDLTENERDLLLDGALWGIMPVDDPVAPSGPSGAKDIGVSTVRNQANVVDSAKREITDKVDQDMLIAAALQLLTTIEETVPLFPDEEPSSAPVLQPNVCDTEPSDVLGLIALDTGSSTNYTEDYLLSIDLGGDDCYHNNAGGAVNGVAVAIDLSGNDHYYRLGNSSDPVVAQGAASVGIGVLLDLGGDDEYVAQVVTTAPEPGPIAEPATVIAQGGAHIGVGVFADLGGHDVIRSTAWSSGNNATIIGQGGADTGVGIALSGPLSADTMWRANATSQRHLVIQTEFFDKFLIGGGDLTAQGGAVTGIAALVDVLGDDTYSLEGIGGRSDIVAQGGSLSGIAALVDAIGEDHYLMSGDGFESLETIVTSGAFCWNAFTITETEDVVVIGQGGGTGVGIGALVDLRGAEGNTLTASAVTGAVARTEVRNSADEELCTNEANATAMTGSAIVLGQGAADIGIGVLLGSFEHDLYTSDADVDARATALVLSGVDPIERANATAGDALVQAQGFADIGIGLILDLLGDDRYLWDANVTATETTSAGTVSGSTGVSATLGQGYASTLLSIGWLLDLGGEDTYSLEEAANNSCWTHPDSPSTLPLARGHDWELFDLGICI